MISLFQALQYSESEDQHVALFLAVFCRLSSIIQQRLLRLPLPLRRVTGANVQASTTERAALGQLTWENEQRLLLQVIVRGSESNTNRFVVSDEQGENDAQTAQYFVLITGSTSREVLDVEEDTCNDEHA